jgi:hypothetical protein
MLSAEAFRPKKTMVRLRTWAGFIIGEPPLQNSGSRPRPESARRGFSRVRLAGGLKNALSGIGVLAGGPGSGAAVGLGDADADGLSLVDGGAADGVFGPQPTSATPTAIPTQAVAMAVRMGVHLIPRFVRS